MLEDGSCLLLQMKERQRWRADEDAILREYVKQYGPREWNLVSQRMNVPLQRDAKSCLERWKNYLKPGIKKGSLTEEEQRLVIRLQAKHGNKWKMIAAEVPGRTAKRLGKWWEVFKEKQQRELKEINRASSTPIEPGKYDRILESFAEKLVKDRQIMAAATPLFPPWLIGSDKPSSNPSVALTLSSPKLPPPLLGLESFRQNDVKHGDLFSEIVGCCREVEEGYQAWAAHKKEAAWRLKRVELQLEAERGCKRKEKIEEIEMKVMALREEEKMALERIEAEYKEQIFGLRRDAEMKEQKQGEVLAAKHGRLRKLLEKICHH